MRDPALELSHCPVELVGADSLELIELGPEDSKVKVMAKINPHKNEEGKIWANKRVVEVIQGFGGLARVSWVIQSQKLGGYCTARKKSLMSWVINTPKPIYVKWNR